MSNGVVSKNLYELLGNTHDEDSDREPDPPVKVVDKTPARTTKRNAPAEAPASKAPAGSENRNPRRGGIGGNEGAFRDRNVGRSSNQGKPVGDDAARPDRHPRHDRAHGTYEGRGNRGRGGARAGYDRHSAGLGSNSEKQAAHGWGGNDGDAELNDEKAGEALAKADGKDALVNDADAVVEPAAEPEPEDNSKSYAEYLAELAEKKLALGAGVPEARKPNEGSKADKKWANAKAIAKEEEEDFVAASAGKAKRERERKQKQVVDIDQRFVEAPERGGSRGGFRGGRGRGDGPSRGGRGDGNFRGRGDRGRGRGEGSFRGRGGAPRGNSGAAPINPGDTSAFPTLGS
ncbi:Uncharacterized protein BP5553_00599 [Venustampulla echinocandica]|uniref:Hyaluronan/mRNA-binding protein domain-containing protein n=1 Tax=Venustampulla echinocandica TaxID=2656787 RepID=A0A370TYN7_9HELO|nr:Uncharacterized protein BP5553_00599 [Venustampulla echinocandica]RDL40620.1 Uncharacterized protein BP5553_00599 [Venustampulla echinocandica]